MPVSAQTTSLQSILPFRDLYRQEMSCQIIHDSIHSRPGWTREFLLTLDGAAAGYGSVAVAGPWKDKPTAYEFFVMPPGRLRVFELFETFLESSGAVAIETQSNDPHLTVMLHAYAKGVETESILFEDRVTTHLAPPGGVGFRKVGKGDEGRIPEEQRGADYLLALPPAAEGSGGEIVATGGLLWHYNRPYGDVHMHVDEPHQRRGLGAYLVQEIKRACYERGSVPGARCNPGNVASKKTLQKAGFVPCGHILAGEVRSRGA